MKKLVCIITAVFIALSVFNFSVYAETLALSKTSIDLPVDYFTTISVSGAKENVEWFSGNKNVAAVEPRDGISADIIGIGEGETYIYAKADGKTLKCRVTVRQAFIAVSNKFPELYIGESKTMQLAISGSREIAMKNSNKEVCSASWGKWDNGMISLTIKAKAEGVSKITVYIKEHSSTTAETITVTVSDTETISLDSDEFSPVKPIDDIQHISRREVFSENCAASIERFAISNKNPYIASPIEYKINNENNRIYVNLTYDNYADIYTLSDCIVDVSVKNGSFYFGGSSSGSGNRVDLTKDAEIIVTDNDGLKKKYTITTERTVYNLPIVNVYLENAANIDSIDRNNYTAMTFSVDTTGDKSFEPTELTSGKIRGRGNSTWKWDKKPYRIKLDKTASVLGLEEDKDWILLANYSDKSLIRNTVAYDMGRCLDGMDWSPTQYPVDLFINGIYRGVYTIGEQMEIAKGRVEIDKKSTENDTGFLLEVGGVNDPNMKNGIDYFLLPSDKTKMIAFKDPDGEKLTNGQRKFIIDYVSKADAAIVSGGNYEDYIDVDSFCDWIIIHELTYNLDSCFRRSCYITKDKGGKLKMGPIWDFDIAFGNCNKDNQNYNDWVTVGKNTKNAYVTENWCTYLMADKSFRSRLRSRWFEVKDNLISTAMKSIDSNRKKIFRSQQENFKVWNIWGTKAGYQSLRNLKYESYELQIQYLKDFISNRAKWIDKNI